MILNQQTLLFVLFVLAALYICISAWTSRKTTSISSYFLANRNLNVIQLTFALIATQLGSGMLLGTAQKSFEVGIYGIMYTVGISLGFILLGCGFAARMRQLEINTTAEIFEKKYHSIALKKFASVLSIISLMGIFIAQIIASSILFQSIGVSDPYYFTAFWSFLIIYTMLGGLQSLIIIDTIQVFLILIVFGYIFFNAFPGSATQVFNIKLMAKAQGYYFYKKNTSWLTYLPTLIIPTLFSLIEQDVAQKFFAARTKTVATISSLLAGIILIIFALVPTTLGMAAKIKGFSSSQVNPLIKMILYSSSNMVGLFAICAIFAAITSTANSLLSAIGSHVAQDFNASHQKRSIWFSRLTTMLMGVIALFISSFAKNDIIFMLENSYRILVICLFVPIVSAYFLKNVWRQAAWTSIITGIGTYLYTITSTQPSIWQDLIPLGISMLSYIAVHISLTHEHYNKEHS